MQVIGITGGVGCGKSTVLTYLEEAYHGVILQTDGIAKALQEKGQQVFYEIVKAFGESILDTNGSLDRSALAEIVFHDEMELKLLNSIVHPAVKRRVVKDIARARDEGVEFLFLESALLLEENYDAICDEMWYIYADDAIRIRRLMDSRGYGLEKITSMMKNQKTKDDFMQHCQIMIDNSGSWEKTAAQIDRQMKQLKEQKDEVM